MRFTTGYNPRRRNDKAVGIGFENCSNAILSHSLLFVVPVDSQRRYEISSLVKCWMFCDDTLKVVSALTPSKIK